MNTGTLAEIPATELKKMKDIDTESIKTELKDCMNGVVKEVKVKRIVTNINTNQIKEARSFYSDVLGLDLLMDHGWIATYGTNETMEVQISFASQGGSQTEVPDISIEVDDVDEVLERMKIAGFTIEYGPTDEPWGVRRFYVRDPFNRLINILAHN